MTRSMTDDEFEAGYNTAIANVLSVIDSHESVRHENSRDAIAKRKSEGKKVGGDLPFGYQLASDGETLRKHAPEQRVIAEARRLRAAGHSLRQVASALTDRGMLSRKNKPFHASQIKRFTDDDRDPSE